MMDKQHVSTRACEVTPSNHAARFSDIEEMQEALVAEGRTMVLRQLKAGPVQYVARFQRCAGIAIMDDSATAKVEFETTTRPGHITFITHAYSSDLWLNRFTLSSRNLLCLPPGTDLHGVNPDIGRVLTIHVPIAHLHAAGLDTVDAWRRLIGGEVTCVEPGSAESVRLRQLHSMALEPIPASERQFLAGQLLDCLNSIAGECADESDSSKISMQEARRVINTAKQHIDANLRNDISMGDVCEKAATSLSKLERVFQRELQMSPARYVRARRLDMTRKELKRSSSSSARVVDIALNYGFYHLGRFSAAYRQQYGELPSETLRGA